MLLRRSFVLIIFAVMDFGVTYGMTDSLHGHPREVRVFRESGTSNNRILKEVALYKADGHLARRTTYREDGSLSYEVRYEFDESRSLEIARTFNSSGVLVETSNTQRLDGGGEKSVHFDGAGIETDQAITLFDQTTNTFTTKLVDAEGKHLMTLSVHYGDNRKPQRARIEMAGVPTDLDLTFDEEGHLEAGSDLMPNLMESVGPLLLFSTEGKQSIKLVDDNGNWIRKIVELNNYSGSPIQTETLVRIISYFE